jgi:methylase of polypeptide subunit release factors
VQSTETLTPPSAEPNQSPLIGWSENGQPHQAHWQSVHGWTPPKQLISADDTLSADRAYRLISSGTGLVWRGDFQNGKQLLAALKRRLAKQKAPAPEVAYPERFHRIRLARSQNARVLGRLLIPLAENFQLAHRRAPSVVSACQAALSLDTGADQTQKPAMLMPLTELIGILSAHEWQRRGLPVTTLRQSIYPRYGVFAPTRHEYLDLLLQTPLPAGAQTALDVGTGTGILAALLAQRGIPKVVATDTQAAALQCAQDNMARLGLGKQVTVVHADLFVAGRFDLIVCNPPWLPGKANNALEAAIHDPDSRMLSGFLKQVSHHLTPQGEVWLILSDLAEHLHLRTREMLLDLIEMGGLRLMAKHDIKPRHPKSSKEDDPLADVRRREITSLWQLTLAEKP